MLNSDIMSSLVSAKVEHENQSTNATTADEGELPTERTILSNVFLMLIAGQETTATTLLMTFLELAIDLEWQRTLQRDLDRIFGDRPHKEWDLRKDAEKLSGGAVGATINEILRLYPPINIIPKGTRKGSPRSITIDGQQFMIPESTPLQFYTVSAHHNPRYWPKCLDSDLDDITAFGPQRWLPKQYVPDDSFGSSEDVENVEGILAAETSNALFRPKAGTYIPFSTGHRVCIGRRFATVEMLAVIAVVFKQYSVELVMDDSSEERSTNDTTPGSYEKVRQTARTMIRNSMSRHLTMQPREKSIALRLVKRDDQADK